MIDTVSDPDARDAGIRQIDNGATYLRLLREVYPQLRRVITASVIPCPPFTVGQSRELIASRPEWLSLGEMCRLTECYPVDSPERAYVCATALEFYPDDPYACNNMAASGPALRRHTNGPSMPETAAPGDPCTLNNPRHPVPDRRRFGEGAHCFSLAAEYGSGRDIQPGAFRRIGLQMVKTTSHSKYCKKNKTMKKKSTTCSYLRFLPPASQLAPATKRKRMLPALPPGTCKSSCGRPRRRQAAGRSTAPGTSGSWHSKNRHGLCLYADIPLAGMNFDGTALTGTVQFPPATTSSCRLLRAGNAGQLHVAGLHGRHPLRCTLRDPYRGEFPGSVHAQHREHMNLNPVKKFCC